MGKFDNQTYEIIKRLQNARLSLLSKQPFYAILLLHMKFALDITCETAYTDGTRIAFNPDFINALSDKELEFVLMHEVLHAALGHPFRRQADYDLECYDKACDIVVNSNILYSFNMDVSRITLKKFGVAMHRTPKGKEGYEHTVEEVYVELLNASGKKPKNKNQSKSGANNKNSQSDDLLDEQGNESENDEDAEGNDSGEGDGAGEGKGKGKRKAKNGGKKKDSSEQDSSKDQDDDNFDSENDDKNNSAEGKGSGKKKSKSKGNKNGKNEGAAGSGCGEDVSEEDLNGMIASLLKGRAVHGKIDPNTEIKMQDEVESGKQGEVDDHSFWNGDDEDNINRDTWLERMIEATDIIADSKGGKDRGTVPMAAKIIIEDIKKPTLDWRTILNEFVQEEICDYSFSPPDKRMEDSPFFLPDFNEKDESVKDILFMIDTSGSMSTEQITECYSEIYGAIGQFGGKLQGKLGFFDAVVVEPIPFEDEEEFKIIRPIGGGGTSFDIIFEYVQEKMQDEPPVSIVILTDGYAPFPEESQANGIPVLWIINNNEVTPPWGKIARILDNVPQ